MDVPDLGNPETIVINSVFSKIFLMKDLMDVIKSFF